ncbi:MAG: rhodanese-like domain-containing protein [Hoeflea sp.]|uniref:rhodanese-like domain-containing protein n=1 Tax=Hoeflea sp. TaxID=1940281 RepID=UPI001DCF0D3F|nr:rhodanese-like domain-containing protein [Hoeflea sp.]MBU4530594.1 rhodanese-like domain-containing protein [Alphaproteobacteria bacterium]MBU4545373.1 rhodanese-like domain-containing protein [Alphaproteobacteria bacterium]MBU4552267.1 rhodanese-like domain-containing protein [Alphaproteobacteria bacterium]MBV1721828.1 rhodanese-like domain-containing protein [Hoeflea sp.]MBV1761516.1 rhodanese-like domain-containing protein [Hoeflea sp.]
MSEPQGAPICIKDGLVSLCVDTPDGAVEIARVPDADHRLTAEWARTSRPAPPAVLQPLVPVAGVVPLGELELIEALSAPDIVVADARKPDQYVRYTIPGAVNLPFTETELALEHLGCRRESEGWDCRDAARVALFCNGVWCGQSPSAIRKMVEAGFPPERILYYHNGLQGWLLQGLSVWTPGQAASFHL